MKRLCTSLSSDGRPVLEELHVAPLSALRQMPPCAGLVATNRTAGFVGSTTNERICGCGRPGSVRYTGAQLAPSSALRNNAEPAPLRRSQPAYITAGVPRSE